MELFDSQKDQPLAPETIEITAEMTSDVTQQFLKDHNIKLRSETRLAPNFYDKEFYVAHIQNIQFYLEHGMVLKKIRRGVIFNHSKWLEPYITLNTRKRKEATSVFEKSFFKLLVSLKFLNVIISYL